ncbi:MAG TPA: hypothetical protein VKI40_04005 [Terriglobales bacterium]|nr:hypothetical protein [Terriglobales bacterium]
MTLLAIFIVVMAALFGLSKTLENAMRRNQDAADRRELARWRSHLPPGNEDPYHRP